MTALASYWSFNGSPQARAQVERMLRGQQIYAPEEPVISEIGPVALGRRLFPTLPEDIYDKAPVQGGGGRWTIVADVRLDAREELCADLGLERQEARALADSALVMTAIERWGLDAIPRLIGDFAIILWDANERRLVLARDFQGRRPLHYHRSEAFVAVASMPKGLHALPDVPREPDVDAAAEFLALVPERTSRSFFQAVGKVLPGEIVTITPEGLTRRSYWQYEPSPLKLRDEEYLDAVRETFERAVSARLRGVETAVGAHLSGGLDSTTVAATAARLVPSGARVVGFTAVPRRGFDSKPFYGRFNDESEHAASVAALYPNMDHVLVEGHGGSPLANLDRHFFLYDRPVLNLCNSVWMDAILDEGKRQRIKILLTGESGNLTISYPGLEGLAEFAARGQIFRLFREASRLKRNGIRLISTAAHAAGPFLPRSLWIAANRLAGRRTDISEYSLIRDHQARAMRQDAEARGADFSCRPWRDSIALRKWVLALIDEANFQKGFLGGWGIDVRDPTVDRRLVELCLSIPVEQFLKEGQTRSIARRAFADRLPDKITKETRKGYQAADWHEGLRAAWGDAGREARSLGDLPAASAIIDVGRMKSLLEKPSTDWDSHDAEAKYRLGLLRGLSAGHFVRRALGAN